MDHDRNHCSPRYQRELANLRLVSRKLNQSVKPVQQRVLFLPIATTANLGRLRYNKDVERRMHEVAQDEGRRKHVREVHVVLYGFGDESETCMADRKDSLNDLDANDDSVYWGNQNQNRREIDWTPERESLGKLPKAFLQFVEPLQALHTIRYISRILNDRTQQPVYDLGIELFWNEVHASIMRPSMYEALDVKFKGAYDKRFIHITSTWSSSSSSSGKNHDEGLRLKRRGGARIRMTQEFITWGIDYHEQDVHDTVVGMHFFTGLLKNREDPDGSDGFDGSDGVARAVVFQDPSGQDGFPERVTLSIEDYNLWLAVMQEHYFFFGEQTTEVSLRGVSLNDMLWGQLLCWCLVGIQKESEGSSYAFLDVDLDDDDDDDGSESESANGNVADDRYQHVGTGMTEYLLMKDCSYSNYFPIEPGVLAGLDPPPQVGQQLLQGKYRERQRLYQSLADRCISWDGKEAFADADRRWMAMLFARIQENRRRKGLPLLDLKKMYGLEEWSAGQRGGVESEGN